MHRLLAVVLACACSGSAPAPSPSPPPPAAASRSPAPAPQAAPEPAPAPAPAPAPTLRGEVVLVALGEFPAAQLDAVEAHLRAHAAVEVRRLPRLPLPREAWTAKRKRYRADRLLTYLEAQIPDAPATTRILGLTAVDISTTKPPFDDWGIFGLGQMPGQAAVVSTYRLRRKAKDDAHVLRRLSNTALHEVGHTFGLDHCTEPRCPMQDAEGGITNTDTADADFAPGCRAALDAAFPLAFTPTTASADPSASTSPPAAGTAPASPPRRGSGPP